MKYKLKTALLCAHALTPGPDPAIRALAALYSTAI